MDFLDPRKMRVRRLQLLVGYALMAVAIGLGTVILVYGANGYSINTKTGDIVQNGLLFVDSKPGGAEIDLNGKSINSNTSARLVLPSGDYDLTIKKTGYRDWDRKFTLDEHAVSRYIYPFLFPNKPIAASLKNYSAQPPLITESPDHHWLLTQVPSSDVKTFSFDQYDAGDYTKAPQVLTIPASVLTNPTAGTLKDVEWSTDNKHLLLRHTYDGGNEFIILDREDPIKSINVNKLFKFTPTEVALRNKKVDQLYLYSAADQTLQIGDTGKTTLATPFLKHVLAFKGYGSNLISYVTDSGTTAGQVQARVWNNDRSWALYTFPVGSKYMLDIAQFQGSYYYVAGSDTADRVNIYKNPLDNLQDPSIGKAIPMYALSVASPADVSFSANTRFIALQGGQNFSVYDLETQSHYRYTLQNPIESPLTWMDGHRLIGKSGDSVFVTDYDATNQQVLVPTVTALGGLFSRDYNQMYTLATSTDGSGVSLERVDMRAGVDLPKQ